MNIDRSNSLTHTLLSLIILGPYTALVWQWISVTFVAVKNLITVLHSHFNNNAYNVQDDTMTPNGCCLYLSHVGSSAYAHCNRPVKLKYLEQNGPYLKKNPLIYKTYDYGNTVNIICFLLLCVTSQFLLQLFILSRWQWVSANSQPLPR